MVILMAYDGKRFDNRGRFGRPRQQEYVEEPKKEEKPKEKPKLVKMPKSLAKPNVVKSKTGKVITVTSKRKSAVARASIKAGKGRITINKVPYTNNSNKFMIDIVKEPITIVEEHNKDLLPKINIDVIVKGGGQMGQLFAARNCIAKAIVKYFDDLNLTQKLLYYNRAFLVDDVRRVESKKPLGRKARAKKQHSKR